MVKIMSYIIYKQIEEKESVLKYLIVFTVYKILIELTYTVAVSHWYSYLGFIYSPNMCKCAASYILFWIMIIVLERKISVNGILVNTFFALCVVPMLSFYWLADKRFYCIAYELLFFIILNYLGKVNKPPLIINLSNNFNKYDTIINIIYIAYIISCIHLGIKRGGIDTRAFSFSAIYDMRAEGTGISGIESYLVEWCAKALFPCLSVFFLNTKRYFKTLTCFFCQIFMYLCFGFKAYILAAAMTYAVYFVCKCACACKKESNIIILLIFSLGLIPCWASRLENIVGTLGFKINNTYAMRMMFEPARIQNGYFEFFSLNDKLGFSEGLIGRLLNLHYPYDSAIGFVITKYLNGADAVSNSNTGIVADSYAQMGVLGIVVVSTLAGIMILLIKRICLYTPTYCVAATLFYPIVMWNDNAYLTNLLTNGWFVDMLMLILIEGYYRNRVVYDSHVMCAPWSGSFAGDAYDNN